MTEHPILIIGGGLVGLATAWKLLRRSDAPRVMVLEKEAQVGLHQSTHNSGVLHAGLYYRPGSTKARLAVTGIREMVAFCQDRGIPHEICGKLVVAADEGERPRLMRLHETGQKNGLHGLRLLDAAQMREIEPEVGGVAALRVPEEGIVDYAAVCRALLQEILNLGGEVRTSARVVQLRRAELGWVAETTAGSFEGKFLVNCGGLHCDRLSMLAGERRKVRIVPFRGEYYRLRAGREQLVRHLIYPVPDPTFPFLGVHFTRLIHGGVEAGPNAVLAFAREGYRKTDVNLADLKDAITFSGLWRFFVRHRRMCCEELIRSHSRRRFCASLQRLVPALRPDDLEPGGAGVRAQAMSSDGALISDFEFVNGPRALHVINAPSPAATASLAIGGELSRLILAG